MTGRAVGGERPEPSGTDAAFERWVVPEIETMLRVARGLTGDLAEAEDLVQDALLRAYRAIDRFDGSHPRAWLLTIVRNTHINRGRRQRPDPVDDPGAVADRATGRAEVSEVEASVVDAVLDDRVDAAFRRLPFDHQRVLDLVDVAGLRYAEAAAVLDVPVGTVMSRLHRARKRLRDHLVATGFVPARERR